MSWPGLDKQFESSISFSFTIEFKHSPDPNTGQVQFSNDVLFVKLLAFSDNNLKTSRGKK